MHLGDTGNAQRIPASRANGIDPRSGNNRSRRCLVACLLKLSTAWQPGNLATRQPPGNLRLLALAGERRRANQGMVPTEHFAQTLSYDIQLEKRHQSLRKTRRSLSRSDLLPRQRPRHHYRCARQHIHIPPILRRQRSFPATFGDLQLYA